MPAPHEEQTCPPNRNIGRTEIKRLQITDGFTLDDLVDELRRQHPVEGFKNRADKVIYIIRAPDSKEPLPIEWAF